MIHEVKLPEETRKRLTDIVYLQMWLLRYASSTSTLDRAGCEKYLQRCPKFREKHEEIAKWLFRGPKRLELLEQFALGPQSEKHHWSRTLSKEVFALLKSSVGEMTPCDESSSIPPWKRSGAEFLRKFCQGMERGLESYFFSEAKARKFKKQDLSSNFLNKNNHLFVCPACDFTSRRTQVDHYLPISLYPHLSCHPFNLVPICIDCNSLQEKGDKDLLQTPSGTRRRLEDISIPYREDGLKNHVCLDINLTNNYRQADSMDLKPLHSPKIQQSIEAYSEVFRIPYRWLERQKTISDTIFRQLKQSIRIEKRKNPSPGIQDLADIVEIVYECFSEAQGEIELRFAMTWWLKILIDKEIKPATKSFQPLNLENFLLVRELLSDVL